MQYGNQWANKCEETLKTVVTTIKLGLELTKAQLEQIKALIAAQTLELRTYEQSNRNDKVGFGSCHSFDKPSQVTADMLKVLILTIGL